MENPLCENRKYILKEWVFRLAMFGVFRGSVSEYRIKDHRTSTHPQSGAKEVTLGMVVEVHGSLFLRTCLVQFQIRKELQFSHTSGWH